MTYEELLEKHRQEANQLVNDDKIIVLIGNTEDTLAKMKEKGVTADELVNVGAGAFVKRDNYDEVMAIFDRHADEQKQYALNHTYEVVKYYLWDYEIEISLSYTYEDAIYKLVGLTKDEANARIDEIDKAIKDYRKEFYEIN